MNNLSTLPVYNRLKLSLSYGKGMYLYDNIGKKYLDFGAGVAVNCLGHCHPRLVSSLQEQSERLWHVSNLYKTDELEQFADNLVNNSFADHVFFCNSGVEAIECGIKTIRKYFHNKNQPHRNRIITFNGAFHGRTIAAISAGNNEKYTEGFGPLLNGFDSVEFNNIDAVKKAINEDTAAILIEPIQGEGGMKASDKQFIKDLRKISDDNDLLLFFDEIQCGMGRTGHLYAYEYYDVIPDIVASAKGIGGGFPLGACLVTKNAGSGMKFGSHGSTYGGNPLAMSVGNTVLDIITKEGFLQKVQTNSVILQTELIELSKTFSDIIEEVRGVGLMIGLKIKDNFKNIDLVEKFKDNGLLVIPAGENVIRILPPLIVEKEHVYEALQIIDQTLKEL